MKSVFASAAVSLILVAGAGSIALADDRIAPETTATTVWVDGKGQSSMASKTNKVHAEMTAQGWRFADMDLYVEDGDMKGIFLTYVRGPATAP
ncbi:MAG: hypothetical protein KJ041_09985 [Gammaproteobacteria bacterium]|nr:hypothetical protein [Gammaproteobacteria bacterium]